jgi:hypothetical protein
MNLHEKINSLPPIAEAMKKVSEICNEAGLGCSRYSEPDRTLMWTMSEITETWEALRRNRTLGENVNNTLGHLETLYANYKLNPSDSNLNLFVNAVAAVKSGKEFEMSDILIMFFDFISHWSGLTPEQLDRIIKLKIAYNITRTDYQYDAKKKI